MLLSSIKLVITVFAFTTFCGSCSSSKKATATASRDDVKGTWVLNNITYEGLPSGTSITLLGEGNEDCLKGSTWVLPNNGYGSYTIAANRAGCADGERKIVWSYQLENETTIFQYKKLEGGVKAKDIEEGYKFKILSADENNLALRSEITYNGRPLYINYNFGKKGK